MSKAVRLEKWICVALLVTLVSVLLPLSSIASQAESKPKTSSAVVNINTADSGQLSTLPGIGPEIAQRIVAYRSEHGLFKSTQDLEKVKGVGEKKLSKLTGLITVDSPRSTKQ